MVALGKPARERTVASCVAGGKAENAERREREADVEKNGMEEPLKRLPRTLAEYTRRKEAE
jgi:hypothetical protein